MIGETDLFIEDINEILNRKNTGPIIKKIELETLADNFYVGCSSKSDTDFLKFTSRYSSAVEILEQQINN